MLEIICNRIEKYLLINDFEKYKIFDNRIKPLVLRLINDIYPPIEDRKSIRKIIKDNYTIISVSMIPFVFILFGWTIGYSIEQNEIKTLKEQNKSIISIANKFYNMSEKHKKNFHLSQSQVDSLNEYFKSREWIEFIIHKEANIHIPEYLPDSVFYMMEEARIKNEIPHFIYWRLINKESTFRMVENISSGAFGYMQVMPPTFNEYKTKLNLEGDHNIQNNIEVGSYYLAKQYKRFMEMGTYSDRKSWELALSCYNAGYGNVIKAGYNIPNFEETIDYVRYILRDYNDT